MVYELLGNGRLILREVEFSGKPAEMPLPRPQQMAKLDHKESRIPHTFPLSSWQLRLFAADTSRSPSKPPFLHRIMLQNNRNLQLGQSQRESMRRAGQFNASLMDYLRGFVKVGITTAEIDQLVHDFTVQAGHRPATLGYLGYPKSCCTSINDVICHGIPSDYALRNGDIVNIDITSIVGGWHGDQSETFLIGDVSDDARAVTQCSFDCLHAAIDAIFPGCTVSLVGEAVVSLAHSRGFSVVKEYVGHGLGKRFHQYPNIPHVPDQRSRQERLLPGLCFTIEPMINQKSRFTSLDKKDNWTVRTRDGGLSAQFEHTILMTEEGPEILTQTEKGPQKGHLF